MGAPQLCYFLFCFLFDPADRFPWIGKGEAAGLDDAQKVGERELAVVGCAVVPDVPDEERIDGAGILSQILLHVEDAVIVERHGDTDLVERRGVALHVLDGVGVGVEDVRVGDDGARCLGLALDEVVVVCVDTGNHALSRLAGEQAHEHCFLAPLKMLHPRWQHDLEIERVGLKLTEDLPPEEDVVVALDIGDDFLARAFRLQPVGCLEIAGGEVVS